MRKTATVVLTAATLALPVANVAAAATKKVVVTKVKGQTFNADRWGTVTINVTVKKTTASGKVTRKFTDLGGSYSYHTDRSQFIMSQALPLLRQEFLTAQNGHVQMISGATYTSEAFISSLQSALAKVK